METTTTEMEQAYYIESYGGNGSKFKLQLFLDIGRGYTDEDKSNIRKCCEDLQAAIKKESVRLDPKIKNQAEDERTNIQDLFVGKDIFMEAVPNEYWPEAYGYSTMLPWFVVTTKIGRIKIGWRKRVIHIDWSGSTTEASAKDLFPNDDVTRYDRCIHAYGYAKAKEYIDTIFAAATTIKPK